MTIKTKAIVLRSVKYGDNSLIVDMLTERCGRSSFIIRLSKSSKGKFRRNLFIPLTILEVDYELKQTATLLRIKDVHVVIPLPSLLSHPYKLSIGMFLSEFLVYATRDENDNNPLYNYVEKSLQWLDGVENHFSNFHLVFMMRMTRFVGFLPYTSDYHDGDYFDMLNGSFCERAPLHSHFLTPNDASKLGILMRLDYPTMHLCVMTRPERNRCLDVILDYYRLHIPGFPELKSYQVLKELFK
ncbi:MAG: DNA repair protein RecO [Prevotella sp.]|nr:DNA repair protein RecO [Prevotella sp.]